MDFCLSSKHLRQSANVQTTARSRPISVWLPFNCCKALEASLKKPRINSSGTTISNNTTLQTDSLSLESNDKQNGCRCWLLSAESWRGSDETEKDFLPFAGYGQTGRWIYLWLIDDGPFSFSFPFQFSILIRTSISWRYTYRTTIAMPEISYLFNLYIVGGSREIVVPVSLSDAEYTGLVDQGNLEWMKPVSVKAQSQIFARENFMCVVCETDRATRMVHSPCIYPDAPDGPLIVDYTAFPICDNPLCNEAALRRSHDLREALTRKKPSLAEIEVEDCENCHKMQKVVESGGMKRCGGCRAKLYCSKECQVQHWKRGHKKICSRQFISKKGKR